MALFVAFNSGETPVCVDDEGHVIEPHAWGVADDQYLARELATGQVLRINVDNLREEDTNPAVIMAKQDLEERLRLQKPVPVKTVKPAAKASATEEKE